MYQNILVPLDCSRLSESSLAHVESLAKIFGSKVTLLTVIEEPWLPCITDVDWQDDWGTSDTKEAQALKTRVRKRSETYLQGIADRLGANGLEVRMVILETGIAKKVADTIIEFARDDKTDLIIMSSHGKSGVVHSGLGSVTNRVLNYSRIPVLAVASGLKESGQILMEIERSFQENVALHARDIRVEVRGDEAILTGMVRAWFEKEVAERVVCEVPGIKRVINLLTVTPLLKGKEGPAE